MLFIVIGSLATAGSFIFILYSFSPKVLRTVLGYRVWLDIAMSLGLTLMAIATGTISGLVIGSLSAIVMTISLVAMKKVYGYARFERNPVTGKREFVEYIPQSNPESIGEFVRKTVNKTVELTSKIVSGFFTTSKA